MNTVPATELRPASAGPAGSGHAWAIVRSILGTVLITAAVLKAYELGTLPLIGPGITDSRWLLAAVVEVELLLGGWLLVGGGDRWAWIATWLLWFAFLGIAAYDGVKGVSSCGCFGRVRVNPKYTVAFDLAVIFALPFCSPFRMTSGAPRRCTFRWAAMGALALAGVASGTWDLYRFSPARLSADGMTFADGAVVLQPEKWVGQRFILASYIDIGPQLVHGNWIVVLYRYDCEHCRRAIPQYQEFSEKSASSVALVEIPPFAPVGEALVAMPTSAYVGKLTADHEWFASTPVTVVLHNGVAVETAEGDMAENPNAFLAAKQAVQ